VLRTKTNDRLYSYLSARKQGKVVLHRFRKLRTETVTQTTAAPSVETFVRTLNDPRYQLIEKKDNKEVYRDRETGSRWVVKVQREDD
jgi:hypothetical protein